MARQLVPFAGVGAVSTVVYVALFALLRAGHSAQVANLVTLLITALANTEANRRLTFGIGHGGAGRYQLRGLVVFGFALALTSGALQALHAVAPSPSQVVEVAVLTAANLAVTVVRFVLLRTWVFQARQQPDDNDARAWSAPQ
jgi:putative flippase GtrA